MDYRTKRMREHIKQAFLTCLSQKDFTGITVADITREAEINRSTFYRYFEDKYVLRDTVIDEKIQFFLSHMAADFLDIDLSSDRSYFQELSHAITEIHNEKDIFLLLWENKTLGRLVFEEMIQAAASELETNILSLPFLSDEKRRLAGWYAVLITNNFFVTIRWWFEHDTEYTAENVAAMMLAHMQNGSLPTLKKLPGRT